MEFMGNRVSVRDVVDLGKLVLSGKINVRWASGHIFEGSSAYHYVESKIGNKTTDLSLRIAKHSFYYVVQVKSDDVEVKRINTINSNELVFDKVYSLGLRELNMGRGVRVVNAHKKRAATNLVKTILTNYDGQFEDSFED